MRYFYPVPNGPIYGASLKIQNTSDVPVEGVYSDCGIFVTYNDGTGGEFPLITATKDDVIKIPGGATVYIHATEPTPFRLNPQCKIAVDSTSLPKTCLLTPVIKLGIEAVGDPAVQVV